MDNDYIRFLLNEAARVDEAGGRGEAIVRRGGRRLKNALLATLGGKWSSIGTKAHGELDTMNVAAALRREWFHFAGQMKGKKVATPTQNNIKAWLKKEFDVDVKLPADQTKDAGEKPALPQSPEGKPAATAEPEPPAISAAAPEAQKAAEPQASPKADETPAPVEPKSEEPSGDLQKMIEYMRNGMGAGIKANEKILAANGRPPEQQLAYLRRMMQAGAGPNTVDPITHDKPLSVSTAVGSAMAKMTQALHTRDIAKVTAALTALVDAAKTSPVGEKIIAREYLKTVAADNLYKQTYPTLAGMITKPQQSEDFSGQYRRALGKLYAAKDSKNPSPELIKQLVSDFSTLAKALPSAGKLARQQTIDTIETLKTDPLVMKFPQLKNVLDLFESSSAGYLSLLLEKAGIEELGGDDPLNRVQFNDIFHDIAQQLIAGGFISNDGSSRGSSNAIDASERDEEEKEEATELNLRPVIDLAADHGVKVTKRELEPLTNAMNRRNERGIEQAINQLGKDKLAFVSTILGLDLIDAYSAESISDEIQKFVRDHGMKLEDRSLRGLIRTLEDGDEEHVHSAIVSLPDETQIIIGFAFAWYMS